MKPVRYWKGKAPEGYKQEDEDSEEEVEIVQPPVVAKVQKEAFVVISTGPTSVPLPVDVSGGDRRLLRLSESNVSVQGDRRGTQGIQIFGKVTVQRGTRVRFC